MAGPNYLDDPDPVSRRSRKDATMTGPRFDSTINLGHVMIVVTMLGSVIYAYYSLQGSVQLADQRITTLEKEQADTITFQSAVLDKLTTIQVDIGVLKAKNGIP